MNPDPISKLTKLPGLFRVDRIAPFLVGESDHLMVGVQLSEIKESHIGNPYVAASLTGQHQTINIHTSFLTRLKVGTIWKEGKLVRSADFLDEFQIDTDNIKYVKHKGTFKLDNIEFTSPIPDNFFPNSSDDGLCKDIWYAIVKIVNPVQQKYLIIPCIELARFFFGVSSRLFSKILHGDLDSLIDWDQSTFKDSKPRLFAKTPLSRLEALVLCRALTSRTAEIFLRSLHKQISLITLENKLRDKNSKPKPLAIKFAFPFSGITSLKVAGKRTKLLSENNMGIWVVNVMEILECPKPFDFATPEIIHDGVQPIHGSSGTADGGYPNPIPFLDEDIPDKPIVDSPSNARFKRLSIITEFNPFPGSEWIRFNHTWSRKEHGSGRFPIDIVSETDVAERSVGKGSYDQGAARRIGLDFYLSHLPVDSRKLSDFVRMLTNLKELAKNSNHNLEINIRTLGNESGDFTCFPPEVGRKRKWLYVSENGKLRTRFVVIAELTSTDTKTGNKDFLYLLEMELKSGEQGQSTLIVSDLNYGHVTDDQFLILLRLSAIKRHWIPKLDTWSERDGKNWMELRSQAQELRKGIVLNRIPHSSAIKERNNQAAKNEITQKNNKIKIKKSIDPKQWGGYIFCGIQNNFPQFLKS